MIQDPRIGRRGPKGRIVQTPTRYVNNEGYTPAANPAPTIFWLDREQEYFVMLPVSLSRIKPETHAMFLKLVGKEDQINFPYNDGSDDELPAARSVMLARAEDDEDDIVPVKKSAAEINAARKAKLLAELAALDEEDIEPEPKKIVKVVKSESPKQTFQLPSFNKKSTVINVVEDTDENNDDNDDNVPEVKTKAGLGLVPKPQEPKVLKSTLKSDKDVSINVSGTDPKKTNIVN